MILLLHAPCKNEEYALCTDVRRKAILFTFIHVKEKGGRIKPCKVMLITRLLWAYH